MQIAKLSGPSWPLLLGLAVLAAHAPVGAATRWTEHTMRLEEGETSPPATLEAARWLAGHWRGEGFGGVVEEVWTAAENGAMLGMFRLIREGQPDLYEIMVLRQEGPTLVLRLKHFGPDLVSWEEREETVDFPLAQLAPGTLYLNGLTLRRDGEDAMTVVVVLGDGSEGREATLSYRRVGTAAGATSTAAERPQS